MFNDTYVEDWFWYRIIDFNPWFISKWNDCKISAWHSLIGHLKLSCCSGVWSSFYFWNSACKMRRTFLIITPWVCHWESFYHFLKHGKATNLKNKICMVCINPSSLIFERQVHFLFYQLCLASVSGTICLKSFISSGRWGICFQKHHRVESIIFQQVTI